MKFWFISCNFIEIKEIFGTFSIGTSCHTTNVTKSTCCSVISNGQYKCFILLLTHFSQQSLRFISIRSYLLISPLTHDWNYSISLSLSLSLSLSFSTHVCIAFNFICNMHSVCLKHLFPCIHPLLVLFFGNRRLCTYLRWSFLPSSFNYSKQSNGEYIQACLEIFFIVTCDTN